MIEKTFSENLRKERRKKGFTQQEISDRLNISRKRYAKWEEGRATPSIEYLPSLCEVLRIDDLYLFLSKDLVKS